MRPATPRLHFSFRSPYSWLAVRRLRRARPDAFAVLDWYPFWDPDEASEAALKQAGGEFHYVQMSRAKHFYLLMDAKRLAAQEGVSMAWPVDVAPHWELPHLGWLVARRAGRAEAFYDAVCEARWLRGEDICTAPVLAAVARQAGLDPDPVLAAVDDADTRSEGVAALLQAYHDDIFGIPYLRWRRHRFWGLDRVDAFLDTWQAEAPDPAAVAPDPAAVAPDPAAVAPDPAAVAPDPAAVAPDPAAVAPDPAAAGPALALVSAGPAGSVTAPPDLPVEARGYDTDTAGGCG